MVIFHSYVTVYQRVPVAKNHVPKSSTRSLIVEVFRGPSKKRSGALGEGGEAAAGRKVIWGWVKIYDLGDHRF